MISRTFWTESLSLFFVFVDLQWNIQDLYSKYNAKPSFGFDFVLRFLILFQFHVSYENKKYSSCSFEFFVECLEPFFYTSIWLKASYFVVYLVAFIICCALKRSLSAITRIHEAGRKTILDLIAFVAVLDSLK